MTGALVFDHNMGVAGGAIVGEGAVRRAGWCGRGVQTSPTEGDRAGFDEREHADRVGVFAELAVDGLQPNDFVDQTAGSST